MRPLLLVPLAVGFAYVAQEAPKRSATVGTGTLEARGVCDIKPDAIACWNLDGAKSLELEDGIRVELTNNREVQFRYGKKNRILAFRRPQTMNFQYRTGANNYLYGNWTQNGEPVTDFVRYAGDSSEKEIVVSATTTIQGTKDEEIAFREGSVGQIDGKKLEIGAMQKVVPSKTPPNARPNYYYNGQPRPGEGWTVVMGVSVKENEYVNWSYVPLDSAGQPIRYVDAKGHPISAMKALALEPNLSIGNYNQSGETPLPKPKASTAYFLPNGSGGAFRAQTNIDPKTIATLRIRASHSETVNLGPFPLDPQ